MGMGIVDLANCKSDNFACIFTLYGNNFVMFFR